MTKNQTRNKKIFPKFFGAAGASHGLSGWIILQKCYTLASTLGQMPEVLCHL